MAIPNKRGTDGPFQIVRVHEVIGSLKDTQRVNVKWEDDTVSTNVRLSDLKILG